MTDKIRVYLDKKKVFIINNKAEKYLDKLAENTNPFALEIFETFNIENTQSFDALSGNPYAVHILKKNVNKINWNIFSNNTGPGAIELIEKNLNKVNWDSLCLNPQAIDIIKKNTNKINWLNLSENKAAYEIFKRNPGNVNIYGLACNPNPKAINIVKKLLLKKSFNLVSISDELSSNPCIDIIDIIKEDTDLIDWHKFIHNPNAHHILTIDFINNAIKRYEEYVENEEDELIYGEYNDDYLCDEYNTEFFFGEKWYLMGSSKNPKIFELFEYIYEKTINNEYNINNHYRDFYVPLISSNPIAINFIEKKFNNINFCKKNLSQNPAAIHILEANPDKISWPDLMTNPNALHMIFTYNYDEIRKFFYQSYGKELVEKFYHPDNAHRWIRDLE